MTERMHAYLATDLTAGRARPEQDEVMKIVEIPFEEALAMARIGKIEDAKTIVTLFLAEAHCGAAGDGAG
jgi:ADP-ribose pyrophosphatase